MALGALALAVGLIAALVLRSAQLLRRATGTVAGGPDPCPSRAPLDDLTWSQVAAAAVQRRSGRTRQRREVAELLTDLDDLRSRADDQRIGSSDGVHCLARVVEQPQEVAHRLQPRPLPCRRS